MPMRLRREETGVEFDVFEGRSVIDEFELEGVDPSFDRVGNFRWGGDEDEMLAALCGAAALAKLTNGIVFDEASDRLLSPDQAIEMAREHVASVRSEQAKQKTSQYGGTRPADLKRYLKPLLELRPDLVLIDRMLIIRPVRHLLRGAFFDRTSDKYKFNIRRYFEPLYDRPGSLGYGQDIYSWFCPVWQSYFRPLLVDCLAEDVFESVGTMTTLAGFAEELRITDRFTSARVIALVLSGQKQRAAEYVDHCERREDADWKNRTEKQRAFLKRDIGEICAEFHAKEAETAKALKLGDAWEPTPFPVEVPRSESATQLADPLFRPAPWIPRPPGLLGDPPDVPGELRFARSLLRRNGRVMLLAPLTPAEAEERHRNLESYVLAARLEGGALALLDWDAMDRFYPDWSENPVRRGGMPDLRVQLRGSDHFVRVGCPAEWNEKLLRLFHLEVDKGGVRNIWSCYFDHKEDQRLMYDYRTDEKVVTRSPLTSRERDLTMFPRPEFGQLGDVLGRIFASLQVAGYGECLRSTGVCDLCDLKELEPGSPGGTSIVHFVSCSIGTERWIVTPSGSQSWDRRPPNWPLTIRRASKLPNPSHSGCPSMAGPPCSRQVSASSSLSANQSTRTLPDEDAKAPYLAAFVANSCRSSARLVTALPPIDTSGPLTMMRSCSSGPPR
jgi:hypothetical protein